MIRSILIDTGPLRTSRPFARLYAGSLAGGLGSALTQFAVLFQVWQLTGSPVATGLLALAGAIPVFGLTPLGGTLADRHDRTMIMRIVAAVNIVLVGVLIIQAFADWRQVWLLYAVVAAQGATGALGRPARDAILPLLVGRQQLAAARALTTLGWQLTALAGPALAGMITAGWGLRLCYAIDGVLTVIGLAGLIGLPRLQAMSIIAESQLRSMIGGVRLILAERPLLAAFGLDLALTLLAFPIALLPALNQGLGGDARSLGLLLSCLGVGGVLAGLCSGVITRADRPGATMTVAAMVWCAAVILLGLAPNLIIAAIAMISWGAADIWFGIPRGTLVQLVAPDDHRGRVAAANLLVGQGGPAIGDVRGGLLATVTGAGPALIIGGVCAAVAALALSWRLPEARRYRVSG